MAQDVFLSPLNPFKLVPADNTKPDGIHTGSLDKELFTNLQDDRSRTRVYLQPVETADPLRLVFSASPLTGTPTLQIVDLNGTVAATISSGLVDDIPGNMDAEGAQMTTYLYKKSNFTGLSGIYLLKLSITWLDATVKVWYSEPFKVAARHPGTLRFTYWHDGNRDGVYFVPMPCRFVYRVKAKVGNLVPGAKATNYSDQLQDERQLYREAFRTWTLYVGHEESWAMVPDWVSDRINRIFNCKTVYLDDKRYKLADGATFNKTNTGELYGVAVDIKEFDGSDGFRYKSNKINVYTSPGAYPYMVSTLTIGGTYVIGPVRIADSTAETAFITAANAALADAELTGTLAIVSGVIQYTLGVGEDFDTASAKIFTTKFSFNYTTGGSSTLTFSLAWADAVIAWNTSTLQRVSVGSILPFSHSYTGATIATVEIWCINCKQFSLNNTNASAFGGTLPTDMEILQIVGDPFTSNTFNAAILAPCSLKLKALTINNCGVTTISNMSSYSFPLLTYINFAANALSQSVMSAFVATIRNNAVLLGVYNGFLSVAAQSPPATLNGTGLIAKSQLEAMGWTVGV